MLKIISSVMSHFPLVLSVLVGCSSVAVVAAALTEHMQASRYERLKAQAFVRAPEGTPTADQDSVDIAVELYAIQIPRNCDAPRFNSKIEDRGLTTGALFQSKRKVLIGSAAFTSWGILGSTIGHETEIHANQWFLGIWLKDRIKKNSLAARQWAGRYLGILKPSVKEMFDAGTWSAEREAYEYELNSAKRFGLNENEQLSIRNVMNYYYPTAAEEMTAHHQEKNL